MMAVRRPRSKSIVIPSSARTSVGPRPYTLTASTARAAIDVFVRTGVSGMTVMVAAFQTCGALLIVLLDPAAALEAKDPARPGPVDQSGDREGATEAVSAGQGALRRNWM